VSPALAAVEGRAVQTAGEGARPAVPRLRRSPWEVRALRSTLLTVGAWIAAILASVPLFSVLYMLIVRGGSRLSWEVLVELPPAGFEMGGGFGNAIVGTLVMVGLGALISVPVGIAGAVFLAELDPHSALAGAVRFAAKTLTGLPSILAGVFAYASVVLVTGTYSAPAGAVALAVLMVPTVLLTAEEAMKMVPRITKDAAYGLGCTRSQVIWKIVLPTAMPGILTGVMLAVARAAGETAPLLFTALFSSYWLVEQRGVGLMRPTASLAVLIYNFSGMPFENQIELAWAASLVLVMIVLFVSVASRLLGRRRA
jgi:phosphate transport system permease protein